MKKIKKGPKLRAQKLDGANLALQFLFKLKVEMELRPSPENIIDQDEKLILGLIWGLMRKFVRFSDDEEHGEASFHASFVVSRVSAHASRKSGICCVKRRTYVEIEKRNGPVICTPQRCR